MTITLNITVSSITGHTIAIAVILVNAIRVDCCIVLVGVQSFANQDFFEAHSKPQRSLPHPSGTQQQLRAREES